MKNAWVSQWTAGGLPLLIGLFGSIASGAEGIRHEIAYRDDGFEQSEAQTYRWADPNRPDIYREIHFSRNRGQYGRLNCTLSYRGPVSSRPKINLVIAGQAEAIGLGYMGSSRWQGSFECPKEGPWSPSIAFQDDHGNWDSDFGRNFQFQFRAL